MPPKRLIRRLPTPLLPVRSALELPRALIRRLAAIERHQAALDTKLGGMFAEIRNQNTLLREILRALGGSSTPPAPGANPP
jgi:hypothetical protein